MSYLACDTPSGMRLAIGLTLGYAGLAHAAFILDTPGPTPAVLHHVHYRRLARPYYPADRDVPGLLPRVVRSRTTTPGD